MERRNGRTILGRPPKRNGEDVRKILWGIGLFLLLFVGWQVLPPPTMNVTAVLGGDVTWAIEPGTEVTEGSELVRIAALAGGEAVAARAKAAGVLREVLVRPGDKIVSGRIVARLEKKTR